jgi:hypothetical protein
MSPLKFGEAFNDNQLMGSCQDDVQFGKNLCQKPTGANKFMLKD